jgi:anthranilate synthase/aminodeoxychorismate synthase-like glutamine amidotransferase
VIVIIDNYDSFTYNLVQVVGALDPRRAIKVVRNDAKSIDELTSFNPEHIIISPGPGAPEDAGVSIEVVKHFGEHVPLLGVCLGHQCIGRAFGAQIVRARRLMHGKTSPIRHDGQGVYRKAHNPFVATRYHSLIVEESTVPDELAKTAWSDRGELMGLRHKTKPIEGVQFHPESFLTGQGRLLIANFLRG